MPWIDSLDWSALNSLRRYPIREGASAQSENEYFNIPDTLITDFSLSASSNAEDRFYISRVFNKLTSVSIEISDWGGSVVGTFEAFASETKDTAYYLNATSNYVGANGKITIGTLGDLANQPVGHFRFAPTATELEPRTISPGIRGIDRIVFKDFKNPDGYYLTGNVAVISRDNLKFSLDPNDANGVVLDVGDNLGLNKQCAVTNCVKSINGVFPDPTNGNISLLGVDCLTVTNNIDYSLEIEDTCCSPCVGCNDLEQLTERLTSLENKFILLSNNYVNVNTQLGTYLNTVNADCACPT
jgi:hypothetical protein